MKIKQLLLVTLAMAGPLLLNPVYSEAVYLTKQKSNKKIQPKYIPGQIIVKFKDDAAVGVVAKELVERKQNFRSITGSPNLDKLIKKYRVQRIKNVFQWHKEGRMPSGRITLQQAREKLHHLKEKLAQKEKTIKAAFPRRTRRAPENAKIPFLGSIYRLDFEDKDIDVESVAREYTKDPDIDFAQPNYIATGALVPDDPYYTSTYYSKDHLWGLHKIQMEESWEVSSGEGIVVAVVDSGIDYNHEDINGNIWQNADEVIGDGNDDGYPGIQGIDDDGDGLIDEDSEGRQPGEPGYTNDLKADDDENGYVDDIQGWDFSTCDFFNDNGICTQPKYPDNDPMDGNGHGTHVAGTIAAVGNNGIGVIGVAPNATVMPLRALNDQGFGGFDELAEAIVYAAMNGADIINNSWYCYSGCPSSPVVEKAVKAAHSLGAMLVFCAGNDDRDVIDYSPQNMDETFTVAASFDDDVKVHFSNYGSLIDVTAPGFDIISLNAQRGNNTISRECSECRLSADYLRISGTSMATPHVSGLAALVLNENPEFTNSQVEERISAMADNIDDVNLEKYRGKLGTGRINARQSLTSHIQKKGMLITEGETSNKNQIFEEFETVDVFFRIINTGLDIDSATATLRTSKESLVNILNPSIHLGPILSQEEKDNLQEPFTFLISATDKEVDVDFALDIDADGTNYAFKFEVILRARKLADAELEPHISDGNVVWQHWQDGDYDIYIYNIYSNELNNLTDDEIFQANPSISGNKIVWYVSQNGGDIILYDLDTGEKTQITNDPNVQNFPDISGNKIVWADNRSGDYNIYLYNIDTGAENQITKDSNFQLYPRISGNTIIWQDHRHEFRSIYMYYLGEDGTYNPSDDKTESGPVPIVTGAYLKSDHLGHEISGNKIVWYDDREGVNNVYLFDLKTYEEVSITSTDSQALIQDEPRGPDISEDKVVWSEGGNIFYYEISSDTKREITTSRKDKKHPSISGDDIVWLDMKKEEIWHFHMEKYPPIPDIKANGSDLPITILPDEDQIVSISISLDSRDYYGQNADWWCLIESPLGWYHYDQDKGRLLPGLIVTYQDRLFDVQNLEIFNVQLSPGSNTFYFGIDRTMDAEVNINDPAFVYDSVTVIVE